MKASRYNIVLEEDDGGALIFNCLSGCFTRLEKESYECYLSIASHTPGLDETEPSVKEIVNDLKAGFFIVDDQFNEISYAKIKHYETRFARNQMVLTIVPTSVCNFGCEYCYEGKLDPLYMDRSLDDSIVSLIDSSLDKEGDLKLYWYGGEPGLAVDTICRISRKVLKIVNEKHLSYKMLYYTNGYLLNKEMLTELIRSGLSEILVTLDGTREVHDARRPLKGGGGTYDVIMKNLRDIAGMIPIFVRTNIDKNNIENFPALLDELEKNGLREKVTIVIDKTSIISDACYSYKYNTYKIREFAEIFTGLYELMLKRNFRLRTVPDIDAVKCASICYNGWYIYANGDVYKCMNHFGHEEESIGNVSDMQKQNYRLAKWFAWDPFSNSHCIECNILPLCQGGCPDNWINSSEYVEPEERCLHWKYTLPRILKLHYDNMKENKQLRNREAALNKEDQLNEAVKI